MYCFNVLQCFRQRIAELNATTADREKLEMIMSVIPPIPLM